MLLFISLLINIATTVGLQCYQCENEPLNSACARFIDVVDCEPGLDTCQTIVAYNDVSAKVSIIKTCTMNTSCDFQINATINDGMPCDANADSWVCTSCCYTDLCNKNTAQQQATPSVQAILAVIVIATFLINDSSKVARTSNVRGPFGT